MRVVGIDPGTKGGFAIIEDGKLVGTVPMPLVAGYVSYGKIGRLLKNDKPDHIFLERVHALYKVSAKSTFSFGSTFGAIQGVMVGLNYQYTLVDPKEWQKLCHAGIARKKEGYKVCAKERSAIASMRLFPNHSFDKRNGTAHDGMIDAALIAFYGWNLLTQQRNHPETPSGPKSGVNDVVCADNVDDSGTEGGVSTLGNFEG